MYSSVSNPEPGPRRGPAEPHSPMTPRLRPQGIVLLLVTLVLLVSAGVVACSGPADAEPKSDETLLVVRAEPASFDADFRVMREYQGQIEARRRSNIGFDLGGILQRVLVDEGAEVGRGATLARLDTERLEVQKRQLEAAVEEAETSFDLAVSTLGRFEQALEREAVSPQDLDEARRRREGAAAALRRVQAQLDGVEVDLGKSSLRAPYHGIVTRRLADEGEALAPGQAILEVLEVDRPRVRVGVPIDVAGRDDLTGTAEFLVGETTVTGTRLAALPEQSTRTRTVDLLFELDAPLGELRVGQIARLRLGSSRSVDALTLPTSVLTESSRGLWSCLVAVPRSAEDSGGDDETFVLERRSLEILELGSRGGEPTAAVRGGLEPGELVVMEGIHRLVPGQTVLLADPATDRAAAPAVEVETAP